MINPKNKTTAAFFDMDGTLTSERTWKGFIQYFRSKGLKRSTYYGFLGWHYPLYFLRRLGLISEGSFRGAWAAHLAWFVRGDSLQDADQAWKYTLDFLDPFWREDTLSILNQHKLNGDLVVLVSSGPLPLLEKASTRVGADFVVGTAFEIKDGVYSGRSIEPTCIDSFKASMAKQQLAKAGKVIDYVNSYAYADSVADLHMLEMVGNPTAVYPEENLKKIALERGWKMLPTENKQQK